MTYPTQQKQAILKKMVSPHSKPIVELAKEAGISIATLYNWRKKARMEGHLLPDGEAFPIGWSSRDKFAAVLETASLNRAGLAEYCRKRGLFMEQIQEWRIACEQANDWDRAQTKQLKAAQKSDEKRIRQLERELIQKEKALAEAVALLVLHRKRLMRFGGKSM